jgi:hypothetical protein
MIFWSSNVIFEVKGPDLDIWRSKMFLLWYYTLYLPVLLEWVFIAKTEMGSLKDTCHLIEVIFYNKVCIAKLNSSVILITSICNEICLLALNSIKSHVLRQVE